MKDENKSPAERLERGLQDSKKLKRAAAASAAEMAPELKRLAALYKKLEALPQNERRKVLDAAGLRHVSAAPKPITPLRGLSSYTPPSRPPEVLASRPARRDAARAGCVLRTARGRADRVPDDVPRVKR